MSKPIFILHGEPVPPSVDGAEPEMPDPTAEWPDPILGDDARPSPMANWPVYTLADAFAERPPVVYAIDGLFAYGTLNIVFGAPGSLKSMLMAEACACVSGGLPWLEPLPDAVGQGIKTTQSPAMWLDFDNGARRTHDRFDAIGKTRKLPADTPLFYVSMPAPWLDMSSILQAAQLADMIRARGIKFVAVDNLTVVSGSADENSGNMANVMANFRSVAETTGACVVVIHHQRKGQGFNGRKGDTLRGHSSIEASLDLALLIEREEGADMVELRGTKVRGVDVNPFGAMFTYEHKPGTKDLAEVRFFGTALENPTSTSAVQEAILSTVKRLEPVNKTTLTQEVKAANADIGVNRIRAEIDRMAAIGRLVRRTAIKNAALYELP